MMESKPSKLRITFVPQVMGVVVFLIIGLGFTAGAVRQELALALTGAVFLALWVYCLVMTLFLALIHSRRARRAFIRISPRELTVGEMAEAVYAEEEGVTFKGRIVQLPGIVVRCRLLLATKDRRRIIHDFNPAAVTGAQFFAVEKRGAYFSAYDEFAVFDILGFFRFTFRIYANRMPVESDTVSSEGTLRLLVSPHAAAAPPPVNARAGESSLKPEFSFRRTDNLIDHRPYVPGDDPRRINWKLYSHGSGLFVREGEYEPPPQSNIIVLIDTEYDPLLYKETEAQEGIDLLCENALAVSLACAESGMDVLVGYSGGIIRNGGESAAMPSVFAWPAAVPLSAAANLPPTSENYGVLILALPRSTSENSAIDRFLNNAGNRPIDLMFLYDDNAHGEHPAAAELCASLYNQRSGIRARAWGVACQ